MQKATKKKIAPIAAALLVTLYIAGAVTAAMGLLGGEDGIFLPLLCWLILGGAVIAGVLLALRQRLREIDGGEEEDAEKY